MFDFHNARYGIVRFLAIIRVINTKLVDNIFEHFVGKKMINKFHAAPLNINNITAIYTFFLKLFH